MSNLSADLIEQKRHLRDKLRFRRKHFTANLDAMARLAAFRAVPAILMDILAEHAVIGAYAVWGDEPDILPAIADAAATLALPHHADRAGPMAFRLWSPGNALTKGPWGTLQPADDTHAALPTLILCPLVGFDRRGGRIGQGGGHYDRYFAAHPDAIRIGIGWTVQEIDAVPTEPTDMALDAIWTEQELMVTGDRI